MPIMLKYPNDICGQMNTEETPALVDLESSSTANIKQHCYSCRDLW